MTKYTDLSKEKIISLDIETYDPLLTKKGSGVYRKDGNILGVSISTKDGFSEYYNLGHKEITAEEKQKNISYLKDILGQSNDKLGANIFYDLDWLQNGYDIQVNGKIHDVQYAEPILDEYARSYSLDTLANKYLGIGKKKSKIDQYAEEKGWKGDSRQYLYMMPFDIVKEYALVDSELPLQIFEKQIKLIEDEELLPIYNLETDLIPLLLQMKKIGVRVNTQEALKKKNEFLKRKIEMENVLYKKYGKFNYNSSAQIAYIFDKQKIKYGYTDKGNPSIKQHFLKANRAEYAICGDIFDIKKIARVGKAVFENVLLDPDICFNGRIHASFHPLRSDDKGTVSGRFSSTGPNLQQVPAKEENYGEECRSMFIPEENCVWGKFDYSQIEYRVLAHYARGPRSDEVREKYNNDPLTDYHKTVMDWTGLDRKIAKNLNFGTMYAMGVNTCAETFGWTKEYAKEVLSLYHSEMPYVKATMQGVISVSQGRRYIKTILKRRARVSSDIAKFRKFYIMFNRLIQGSAADIMKKGMVDAYKAGIFEVLHPHLTVHDEIDASIPKSKAGVEAVKELANIMENCIQLKVPIKADIEIGENWGTVSEEKRDEFFKKFS